MTDIEFQQFVVEHLVKLSEGQVKLSQDIARLEFKHGEKLSALFDGYQVMSNKLDEHSHILNEHSATLSEHSRILNQHSATLSEHSRILADHTERLQRIEDKVEAHDIKIEVLDKTKSNKRKAK